MPTVNLSDEQIATIEAALKMARGSAHGMLTAVDHGNKARQTVDAIDSALAALRAPTPQPALPEPDWASAPEWAMWFTVDLDGRAKWWRDKPILMDKYNWWLYDHSNPYTVYPFNKDIKWVPKEHCVDWRTTLRRRPQP